MEESAPEAIANAGHSIATRHRRSDGFGFLTIGWLSIILAAVILYIQSNDRFSQTDAALPIAAGGLLSLGLFLVAIGLIIRALWFLPGDPQKEAAPKR